MRTVIIHEVKWRSSRTTWPCWRYT